MSRFRRWLHFRGVHVLCRERWQPIVREFIRSTDGMEIDITNQSATQSATGRTVHY